MRNVTLAQEELDELAARGVGTDPARVSRTLLDLGRSFVDAGRAQDAVDAFDAFEAVRELFPGAAEWLQATDALARLLLGAGMDEAALVLAEQLRAAGGPATYCDWIAAQALAQLGDVERAWSLLSGVAEVVDAADRRYSPAVLRELRDLVGRLRRAA